MDYYKKMWEDFAEKKSENYTSYKFIPTYRVGLTNYVRELVLKLYLAPKKSDIVLDAGCASGKQLLEIADQIKEGVGLDIAENFIKTARFSKKEQGSENIKFFYSDMDPIPYGDKVFDKVFCAEVLEHVFSADKLLDELVRVLKDDGVLVVTIPNLNADGTIWGRFLRFINVRKFESLEHFSLEELRAHGDAHVREFTGKSIKSWLESRNLRVSKLTTASFIDGPFCDFFMKFFLHVPLFQKIIINFEIFLSKQGFLCGRHLIVQINKKI